MSATPAAAAPATRTRASAPMTAIYVAYGVRAIDVSWLDPDDAVVIVHNDDLLRVGEIKHAHATDLVPGGNLGFGAGINAALHHVCTERVVLCNPDTVLTSSHRRLLASSDPDEVVSLALEDAQGEPTWTVLPYPGAIASLAMGYRLGRALGRRSRVRALASRLLTAGRPSYGSLLGARVGSWPLATHWVSAAVMSIATQRLRAVDGFDASYFLYMEDVDLCRRLAARFPAMRVRLPGGEPGLHMVGASAGARGQAAVELQRLCSLLRYCSRQPGFRWRMVAAAVQPRARRLALRAGEASRSRHTP